MRCAASQAGLPHPALRAPHPPHPPVHLQFVESKAFAGGAQGVAALAAALDLGATLTLQHMDLGSLKDPKLLPVPVEVADPRRQPAAASGRASRMQLGACCGALPGCGGWRSSSKSGTEEVAAGHVTQEQQQSAGSLPTVTDNAT